MKKKDRRPKAQLKTDLERLAAQVRRTIVYTPNDPVSHFRVRDNDHHNSMQGHLQALYALANLLSLEET